AYKFHVKVVPLTSKAQQKALRNKMQASIISTILLAATAFAQAPAAATSASKVSDVCNTAAQGLLKLVTDCKIDNMTSGSQFTQAQQQCICLPANQKILTDVLTVCAGPAGTSTSSTIAMLQKNCANSGNQKSSATNFAFGGAFAAAIAISL
ncbi:hypothetical protein HDU99_006131, partial [Rhizoclosmatium hyalinum]